MSDEVEVEKEFTKHEEFKCSCGNWQDYIVAEYDRMDFGEKHGDNRLHDSLYFYTQMNHYLPWYKRLVNAVRYVVGYESKWIHWSETLLSHKDAIRLKELLEEYIDSPHTDKSK